jgi:two-component system chemotaxis response regulator CheB
VTTDTSGRKSTRVLVVDDSAFARKVLREVLTADPRIEVVGIARDGLDALEKIATLEPDVVTLDLVMPELDGLGVLAALRERLRPPRVVVVTTSDAESTLGVAALQGGAFDVVHKPTALATSRLYELGAELVAKVIAAATSPVPTQPPLAAAPAVVAAGPSAPAASPRQTQVLVVGASTGGPRAITYLLRSLPSAFPVPIAIVVHMPVGYTDAFARRLDVESALHVVEAAPGTPLEPGTAIIARAGTHLRLDRNQATLDVRPLEALHRPSVDELFMSTARAFGPGVLAVVLTGMGADGLEGARAVRAAGGRVLVEAASTCVVYGMPRVVFEAGLADAQLPLDALPRRILEML